MNAIVLVAVLLVSSVGAAGQGMKIVNVKERHLDVLLLAESFDDAQIGDGGERSENYASYAWLAGRGAAVRDDIERILAAGSPAGRLYAALLILRLDSEAGRLALEELRGDMADVSYRSGCEVERTRVGEIAGRVLRGEHVIFLDQSPSRP